MYAHIAMYIQACIEACDVPIRLSCLRFSQLPRVRGQRIKIKKTIHTFIQIHYVATPVCIIHISARNKDQKLVGHF